MYQGRGIGGCRRRFEHQMPLHQAIISTSTTSKTIARTATNVRTRVPLAPRSVSTRKSGDDLTISLEKDLHATTQDQSPAEALQLLPKTFTMQTPKRIETARRLAVPRMFRHRGFLPSASGFKKRNQEMPSRMGGENTAKMLKI